MKKIPYLEAIALFMQGYTLYYLDNGVYLQIKVADNVKRSLLNFKKISQEIKDKLNVKRLKYFTE